MQSDEIIKDITCDIDIDYDEWYNSKAYQSILKRIRDQLPGVKSAFIRRSSNNHVHVKVVFNEPIDLFLSFQYRAFLDDDAQRLACDLNRMYASQKIDRVGRCFDEKYTRGKVRHAGEWVKIV